MLSLETPEGRLPIDVIVSDLDRTLTDARLRSVPAALRDLQAVRARGVRTILATGRRPHEIRRRRRLLAAFDAFILEGGGLVGPFGALRRQGAVAPLRDATRWLRAHAIAYDPGETILTIDGADARRLRRYPRLHELGLHRNHGRVDITCLAVDKGTGLRALLRQPAFRGTGRVVALGDAENDLALFRAVDYRVAVANAAPALRRAADEVTRGPGGHGVSEFLRRRLVEADGA